MSEKTYTEAEFNAVTAQVADLEAKVAELAKAQEESEMDSRFAEVKAEAEAQIADLQAKLDTVTLEAKAATDKHDAFVAELQEIEAGRGAAEELEASKEIGLIGVGGGPLFAAGAMPELGD